MVGRLLLRLEQILLLLLRALLLDLQARLGVLLDDLELGVGRQQRPGSGSMPPVLAPPRQRQRQRPAAGRFCRFCICCSCTRLFIIELASCCWLSIECMIWPWVPGAA